MLENLLVINGTCKRKVHKGHIFFVTLYFKIYELWQLK